MTVTNPAQIKIVPIDTVTPALDNPRRIGDAAIDIVSKSLKRFGWQQPIVVDRKNVIIAGHTRILAAKKLGLTKIPIIVAENLTDKEAKAYRIADNRTSDFTQWDFPELVQQLDELASEFSDELAIADWEAINLEYDELTRTMEEAETTLSPTQPEQHRSDTTPDNTTQYPEPDNRITTPTQPATEVEQAIKQDYVINVVCDSEKTLATVQQQLLEMEGVIDVRYQR